MSYQSIQKREHTENERKTSEMTKGRHIQDQTLAGYSYIDSTQGAPCGSQINDVPMNYYNILGPSYVDIASYIERSPDAEILFLELGERAATHLIIDTAMFKTELALLQSDGWWGNEATT